MPQTRKLPSRPITLQHKMFAVARGGEGECKVSGSQVLYCNLKSCKVEGNFKLLKVG